MIFCITGRRSADALSVRAICRLTGIAEAGGTAAIAVAASSCMPGESNGGKRGRQIRRVVNG